jgi:hypothetical protein
VWRAKPRLPPATMKSGLLAGAVRAYSTRIPRPRLPQRPPTRKGDPLAHNSNARVQSLPENVTFIHRPPPTAPSPYSLTTAPTSAFLLPPSPMPADPNALPPLVRKDRPPPNAWVSDETVEQIKTLRKENPERYTRNTLARLYGVTPNFVGMVAPTKMTYRKEAHRRWEATLSTQRATWGERRMLQWEVRQRRREFW